MIMMMMMMMIIIIIITIIIIIKMSLQVPYNEENFLNSLSS